MRQIKFRIWDGHTKSFFGTPDTHYLPKLNVDENGIMTIEPKDETYHLMQFTGLLDKNGKEIYEGDILKVKSQDDDPEYDGVSNVVWKQKEARWELQKDASLPINFYKDYEIIGNIHENPELIH